MNASPPQSTANVKTSTQPEHRLMLFKMPSFGSSLASWAKVTKPDFSETYRSIFPHKSNNANKYKLPQKDWKQSGWREFKQSRENKNHSSVEWKIWSKSKSCRRRPKLYLAAVISDFLAFTSIILQPPLHLSQFVRTEFTKITSAVTANQVTILVFFPPQYFVIVGFGYILLFI